jgi:biotin transport system substrate-specific component
MSASSGSLLSQSIAHSSLATPIRVAAVGLATALTATAAQFSVQLPFTAVPFVLTPMVVLLSGAVLGSRLGAVSQVLYLIAGVSGLAVFAPSATLPPGAGRLLGPTGGYLIAYPLAAFVTGWLAERGWDRRYATAAAAMLLGLLVIFAGGVSWLALSVTRSVPAALATGFVPFILPDVVKIAATAAILPQAWRFLGPAAARGRTDSAGTSRD